MNIDDRPRFEQMLDEIGDAIGTPENRVIRAKRVYFKYLRDIPLDKLLAAGDKASMGLNAFPTVNQLREFCHADDAIGARATQTHELEALLSQATEYHDEVWERELRAAIRYLKGA